MSLPSALLDEDSRQSLESRRSSVTGKTSAICQVKPTSFEFGGQVRSNVVPPFSLKDDDKALSVVEYEWPENSGIYYFIEEYLVNFLGIKSIRRSYPKIERRRVMNSEERDYLFDNHFVTELQYDLGLIVIKSEEVYKHVAPDFQNKFGTYRGIKKMREYDEFVEEVWDQYVEKSESFTAEQLRRMSIKCCGSWNFRNYQDPSRREFYLDSQTSIVHQRAKTKQQTVCERSRGYFPVIVLASQYVDFPRRYTTEELKCFPINTVVHFPVEVQSVHGSPSLPYSECLEDSKHKQMDPTSDLKDFDCGDLALGVRKLKTRQKGGMQKLVHLKDKLSVIGSKKFKLGKLKTPVFQSPRRKYVKKGRPKLKSQERQGPKRKYVKRGRPKRETLERQGPKRKYVKRNSSKLEISTCQGPKRKYVKSDQPKPETLKLQGPKRKYVKRDQPKPETLERQRPKRRYVKRTRVQTPDFNDTNPRLICNKRQLKLKVEIERVADDNWSVNAESSSADSSISQSSSSLFEEVLVKRKTQG